MTRPFRDLSLSRSSTFLMVAVLSMLAAAPGWAHPHPASHPGLDESIDLSLRDADAREVLTMAGQILKLPVEIDPALDGEVTIELHSVRLETALNAVCESIGCVWHLDGDATATLVVKAIPDRAAEAPADTRPARLHGEALRLALRDADAREVLVTLADLLDASLDLDPKVRGHLDIDAPAMTIAQILDHACTELGCSWRLRERGGERVLVVGPR